MRKPSKPFVLGCLSGALLGAVGLVAAVIAGIFIFKDALVALKEGQLRPPPITSGMKADFAWKVKRLDGTEFDLSQVKGKAVFLHFWSPGCFSCLPETRSLNRLYGDVQGDSIAFVCVALSQFDKLPALIQQEGIDFPVYTYDGKLPETYKAEGIPATFIIAPNGDLVFKHVGSAKWDDPSVTALLQTIAATAQAPPAAAP